MLNLLKKSCRQHCRIYTTTHTFQILQFVRGTREIRFHFINNIIIVFNSVLLCFDHCQLALEVRYVRNQRTDTVILEHKKLCKYFNANKPGRLFSVLCSPSQFDQTALPSSGRVILCSGSSHLLESPHSSGLYFEI